MADKPPEGFGRGGRGAALLAALKSQPPRRPGETTAETSEVAEQKPMGRGAQLRSVLALSRGRAIPAQQEESELPKLGRGRAIPVIGRGLPATNVISSERKSPELPTTPSPSASSTFTAIGGRGSPLTTPTPVVRKEPTESRSSVSPPSPSSLSSELEELTIGKYKGTSGTPLELEVNYVRLKIMGNEGIYEYHVSFKPSVDSKRMKFRLISQQNVRDVIGNVKTFDGSKLYLPRKLPAITELYANLPTDNSQVLTTIKYIKVCRPSDLLHLYNLLFRKVMHILKMTQVGRNYFDPKGSVPVPQHKLEVWPGYVTAVQEYEGGVMLNCDASFKVLRTVTARDIMHDATKQGRNARETVAKALIGAVVLTKYNNKTYRIDDIAWDMNPNSSFTTHDQSEITFMEYYKKAYDLQIQDVSQPLLINKAKKKIGNESEQEKLICLIPEFCFMTGLTDEMRADFKVMKDISSCTRVNPERRQLALRKFMENINNCPEAKECFTNWNLQLDLRPVSLEGRTLASETLFFGRNMKIQVNPEADWGRQATNNHVLVPVNFEKWVLVFTKRDAPRALEFAKMLRNVSPSMGIQVNEPVRIEIHNDRTETYCEALKEAINPTVQIVVIIFPTARDDRYSAVKKLCCVDMPVPSQVINSKTISQPQKLRSIVQKIALQMNCKLGGELWSINIPIQNLMICGMDTYHEASRSKKSVLAFVASMNQNRTRWFSMTAMQKPGQEAGDCLKILFISALRKYFEVNHCLPEKVVLFRDGVGDGQIDFISKYEVEQLTSCYKHFSPDYSPALSVVVVQKRINTRMYAVQKDRGRSVLANPPPGSVLDHSVTRKSWYDYFLVSQHVRQGTVSPTHYVVIYDTSSLKPEHMQKMTYKMTHMYYNWPGTVRVPAPCQYAHKLAYLVGQNLHRETHIDLSDRLFYL